MRQNVLQPHILVLKTVYKYATLTVMHKVELSFICEPHKSWSNVSNTALDTVSILEAAKVGSTWQL